MIRNQKSVALVLVTLSLLACVGCGPGLMMQTQNVPDVPADKAMVTFVRATMYGGKSEFILWDREELVGAIEGKQYIQKLVEPGEHLFVLEAQNSEIIKATLEPGKKYYVLLNVSMGFSRAVAVPIPITKTQTEYGQAQINEWMANLSPVTPNPQSAPAWAEKRLPRVRKIIEKGEAAPDTFKILSATDSWD